MNRDVNRDVNKEQSVLFDAFREMAAERHDQVAVRTTSGEILTYGELSVYAQRLARGLARHGVLPGTVVATRLENSPGYVALMLALCRLGAVHLPISPASPPARAQWLADQARPALLVTSGDPAAAPHGPRAVALAGIRQAGEGAPEVPPVLPDAGDVPFRLLETSGSTGRPKLVAWRQPDLLSDRTEWIRLLGIAPGDVLGCMHPLDVAHGTDVHMWPALLSGAELLLVSPAAPSDVLAALREHAVTVFSALPRHYEQLAEAAGALGGVPLPHLRLPLSGGAYLGGSTVRRVRKTLGVGMRRIYGSTEFGIVLGNFDGEHQEERGMRPLPGVEVRLAPLRPGTPRLGELIARSAATASGYYGNPEATAASFQDGWYHTGDVAELGADGEYRLLGRVGDAIAAGDGVVFAPPLEETLADRCPVREVVVLAGATGGVLIVAAPSPGVPANEAADSLTAVLEDVGIAAPVRIVDEIPHTPVGKPDRPRARELYG
ncbi:class I adenylate-forming enzyme family protein [Streptomyces flavidovirens]|uniref:class I adenylate-forming enzyme family protein n=1 Tax=Streptomyces flavidovirens TaxID=67298 RepID=UPI0003FFB98D|nr:AMP-binding protein [Streptomyces flavidovirens]